MVFRVIVNRLDIFWLRWWRPVSTQNKLLFLNYNILKEYSLIKLTWIKYAWCCQILHCTHEMVFPPFHILSSINKMFHYTRSYMKMVLIQIKMVFMNKIEISWFWSLNVDQMSTCGHFESIELKQKTHELICFSKMR